VWLFFYGVSNSQLRPNGIQEFDLFLLLTTIKVPEDDLQAAKGNDDDTGFKHGKNPESLQLSIR